MDQKEFLLEKPYAEIKEINRKEGQDTVEQKNEIRVYCTRYAPETENGSGFNFQIRTFKPINDFGKGKPRKMIATVSLDVKTVKEILKFMEEYKY